MGMQPQTKLDEMRRRNNCGHKTPPPTPGDSISIQQQKLNLSQLDRISLVIFVVLAVHLYNIKCYVRVCTQKSSSSVKDVYSSTVYLYINKSLCMCVSVLFIWSVLGMFHVQCK